MRSRSRRLALEPLENRALLAASVDGAGLLTIVGTERADVIVVSAGPTAGSVSLRGVAGVPRGTVFTGVAAIQVMTLGGSDRVIIGANVRDSAGGLIGVVIDTGRGNDTVDGGEGADEIRTGDGNDVVRGRGGVDDIWLGTGNDIGNGGEGADTIHGENGRDTIAGGAGDDSLTGGADNDSLSGDGDDDSLSGGTGNDALSGGAGDDQLDGDDGRDRLRGGLGNDDDFDDTDGLLDESDDDEGPNDDGADHDDVAGATPIVFADDGTAQVTGTSVNRRDKKVYSFTAPADRTLSVTILPGSDGRRPDLEIEDVTGHQTLLELEPQDGGASAGVVVLLPGHTYTLRLRSPNLTSVTYAVDLLMHGNG